ncbi:MAG: PAS domain-containing protein [Pseudomonadota bacterium]
MFDLSPGCAFLVGGGEMGALIRAHDWSRAPFGAPHDWPQPLQTLVSVMLGAKQPMFIAWGAEHHMLYNDAYAEILGGKHPGALGAPLLEVWSEIRRDLLPLVEQTYAGRPVHMEDITLITERHGYREEAHFAFSYTPVRNENGEVSGFFCPCIETTRQVLAERRLTEDTARQRRLFECAPGFITILKGPEHVFEFANLAYSRLVGERDLLGKTVREVFPELAGDNFFERLDQVYRTGQRYIAHHKPIRLQTNPASPPRDHFLDFIYEPVTTGAGQVTGIFIEGYDVTETHLAQEAQRASELKFRTLAEAMPNQVWTAAANGQLDWFNDRVYAYSAAAEGELDGESWSQLVHPDDRPSVAQRWAAAVATGSDYETEFRLRRADGSYRWHLVRAVAILAEDGQVQRWIGTNTDIHDQKMAAQNLRELNDSLEMRVEARTAERDRVWRNSRDLLAIVDSDGLFRAVNPAWTEILGYRPDEMKGRSFLEFVWPEDVEPTRRELEAAVNRCDLSDFENRYRHQDGTPRWISWHTSVESELVYAYGRHISAEKEQAEALQHTEELLRQAQKMEALGQLTGGIAHDFNNLLAGIIGSLELIQTRLNQGRTEPIERYTRNAMSSAQRAAALTHRLLAFARRQPLAPKSLDANRLLGGMRDLLRGTIGPLHRLDLIAADALWPILCDPNQLESAILNLALNARDAMPEGGSLQVQTANARCGAENGVSSLPAGDYVTITVRDSGTGMPAETLERACEPFFTTKSQGQGTGLGLSMVYGFAQQSGGHLELRSQAGEGTIATVYLPRHSGALAEEPQDTLTEVPRAQGDETVLLVEDDPIIRNLITEVLQGLGYHTLAASDGPSGLHILQTHPCIDLLVTDIGLPGLDGRQLAEYGLALHLKLKVLFITGYAKDATSASGFMKPGMEMMTKPFAVAALANKIRGMMAVSAALEDPKNS